MLIKMKFILTIVFLNFILIYAKEKESNDSISDSDSLLDDNIIENIFQDMDKLFSDIVEEIDFNGENEFIDGDAEVIFSGDIQDIDIKSIFEQIEKDYKELEEDLEEEDESIWPERPTPKYKFIV